MPLGVWTLRKHSVIEKTRHNSRPEESSQTSGGPGRPEEGWRSASPRPAQDGPPQYRGSGWSGAWSGQDPSEVLGGPAAASGEIRRGQPKSGQFWL